MIASARRICFQLLCRIEFQSAFSDAILYSPTVTRLDQRDRNLVTEIFYGTLRWQGWLDHVLAPLCSRPWEEVDDKVKILLRMSLYQMAKMDRVPPHAVIHNAVELAKREQKGSGNFVNGVLRRLNRWRPWIQKMYLQKLPLWVQVSLPEWLWNRWSSRYGIGTAREYALSLNSPPQTSEEELVAGNESWIMDESSRVIPYLFGSVEGKRIWDACAAPGGKSAILHRNCGPAGMVVSSDLRVHRARRMMQNLRDVIGEEPAVLVLDATRPSPFCRPFDSVLADVPCSGLGTLRQNPEIKWRFNPAKLTELQGIQLEILGSVAREVRVGGSLLYSTCSTEPEENEQVIEEYLRSHPEFSLVRPSHPAGIGSFLDDRGIFRSYPALRSWDGFFAALMLRIS